ncbi:hypothetical protein GCM10007242_45280 [Pigmentiphaga litoralis]|uniref:hypothetical protein n=1 Tax=Pigmentiphaga litoralis TaxID=516702 RepID=UPI0016737601|nr:hypothetical protein [Pigmentiphaga litoralis]GGX33139.1 hypothetical protein GCM10007242_45280 [Pigmentiphaga litoralis]
MPIVVIKGPQGCGKTRHAALLSAHFGCTQLIEEAVPAGAHSWSDGSLVMISGAMPPDWHNPGGIHVLTFAEALPMAVSQQQHPSAAKDAQGMRRD